jgi:hypothetical protein
LKGDFFGSRSQGFTFANEEVGFYRGTHLQQSFYEGETVMKGGFLGQRKDAFTMVYSRILLKEGLLLDVAKVSGGPDLSTSSVITKNILEYVSPSSGFEGGSGFPSMVTRGKGYVGAFPSMYSRGISLAVLGSMEYGIQSSEKWQSVIPRVNIMSRGKSKSLSSLVSLNVLTVQSQQNISPVSISRSVQNQLSSTVLKQLNVQISGQQSFQVSVQDVLTNQVNVMGLQGVPVFNLMENPMVTTTNVPFIPFMPLSAFTGGVGGGYGGSRRRKKGSRYRIHPVRLYDVLYVTKRIAL